MPPPQSSCWVFTLNNYDEEEISNITKNLEEAVYGIFAKEIAPTTGTPHLQGFVHLRRRCHLSTIKRLLGDRAHVEVARGSDGQNREYCIKGGDYREFGDIPSKKRTRDEHARNFNQLADARGHRGVVEFADSNPGLFAFNGYALQRNYLATKLPMDRPDIHVDWFHGPPGVGKSRRAHEMYPEAYIKDPRTKWWNGYMLEKEVIIDDFGPQGIDINHLLRWFDRYKCTIETKGGMCPLYAVKFVVTSNFTPEEVFTDNMGVPHKQIPALMRRINVTEML